MKKQFILAEWAAEGEGPAQIEVKSFAILPIVSVMNGIRSEPRTALIAHVEVFWDEKDGSPHQTAARMEDRSPSGACIRVSASIDIGSRVKIKWRWEEFWGVTKYCRKANGEYLLGIQRSTKEVPESGSPRVTPPQEKPATSGSLVSNEDGQIQIQPQDVHMNEIPGAASILETKRNGAGAPAFMEISKEVLEQGKNISVTARMPPTSNLGIPRSPNIEAEKSSQEKERTPMSAKWLDVAFKRQKDDAPNGKTSSMPLPVTPQPGEPAPTDKIHSNGTGKDSVKFQGDFQSMEDVYYAAGIMNPRMGYSIGKVLEMLHSDHMRGLPPEAKRAAVLMALDSAGVIPDIVLKDAARRQDALASYEANQRKHFEDYWARKAEANAQTQAEMERITAQCLERIKRNLDEVAQEKAAFAAWQATKQEELDRMTEALELFTKPAPSNPASGPVLVAGATGATVKPS